MALSTAAEIEAFADKLTEAADVAHAKVVAQAKSKTIGHEEAQNAFIQILLLRQQAQTLFIDASANVLNNLELAQNNLLNDICQAGEHIAKIAQLESGLTTIAKLLELVAKVQAADVKGVIAVTKELRDLWAA